MKLHIQFADRCAWRAVYFSTVTNNQRRQFMHFSIDPSDCYVKPTFSGSCGRWHWRIRLPVVRWVPNAGPLRRAFYQASARFWHGMDGRFGWGTRKGVQS